MARLSNGPISVIIDGDIGAGKSTIIAELCKILKENKQLWPFTISPELLSSWENYNGLNLLHKMYTDEERNAGKSRWVHRFQMKVIIDMINRENCIGKMSSRHIIVQERNLESARDAFIPMNEPFLDSTDYRLLTDLAHSIVESKQTRHAVFLPHWISFGFIQ